MKSDSNTPSSLTRRTLLTATGMAAGYSLTPKGVFSPAIAQTKPLRVGVLAPLSKSVAALIEAKGALAPESQAAISKILLIARADIAVLLLVVVDMVTKPFS